MTTLFTADDFRGMGDRRAVLAMLTMMAGVDGQLDPREIALMRPLFEVSSPEELAESRAQAAAVKSAQDVYTFGQRCAAAMPDMGARERLVSLVLAIGWADGALAGPEFSVIGAFMQGVGVPGERCNELADASAETSIFGAISRGKIDAVKRLLDGGTPVMSRDPKQWTPLHVAVVTGHLAIVELLLGRGADVHAKHSQGSPPLFLACNKPYEAIVERLLKAGAKVDEAGAAGLTPLIVASLTGQTGVARALRKAGAPLEAVEANGRTALQCAAAAGKGATVAFLVAEGAVVPPTALLLAAESRDVVTVAALIAGRANVNVTDANDQTALFYAVAHNAPDVVELLLAAGANPNAHSKTSTFPLHVAAGGGRTACARLLLDGGARHDVLNADRSTPAMLAALGDRREVYELLVARGATAVDPTKMGAALAIATLRAAPLTEPLPAAGGLAPDLAALKTFDDWQMATWVNTEGQVDQVAMAGRDAKGRPEWASRARAGQDPRARHLVVTDAAGKRWLPLFTSDAAAAAFRSRAQLAWPESGTGFAAAVTGSTTSSVFKMSDLPIDGVVVNPFGPSGPAYLSADLCDRIPRG